MSVNLRLLCRQTGLTVYGFIRRVNDGYIYSTVAGDFVAPVTLDVANYVLSFTEDPISKQAYVYENSDDWDIGRYTLEAYSQVGGSASPALDDRVCDKGEFNIQNRGVYTGYLQPPDPLDNLGNVLTEFVTSPLGARLDTTVGALVESTAEDGSTTTLEDTTHSWGVNALVDAWIKITCAASGVTYPRQVTSNTANEYTFSALPESVVVGDKYVILSTIAAYDLVRVGGTPQTGGDLTPYVIGALQSSTTHVANDVTVLADTEGSYVLPANAKMIQITMIDGSDADQYFTSFTTGHVAPRGVQGDQHYGGHKTIISGLNLATGTIYFATTKVGGATFHIEAWS